MKVTVIKKPEVIDMAGEKVMIDFESGKYFMLKGVANDIWGMLEDQVTSEEIIAKLRTEYDVDQKMCAESVDDFLNKLCERGFIRLDK